MGSVELLTLVSKVNYELGRLCNKKFADIGLTTTQAAILTALLSGEAMTQREITDACRMDTTTLSRVLDKMEKKCLIERQALNRRSFHVRLTDVGAEKAKQSYHIYASVEQKLVSDFNETNLKEFMEMYQAIYKVIQEESANEQT